MRGKVEIKSAAHNVLAQETLSVGFGNRSFKNVEDVAVLTPNVNVSLVRSNRAPRDDRSLDHLVWVHFHQRAIFGCARLALIRIAEHVFRLRGIFRDEAPFHSCWESSAAAS